MEMGEFHGIFAHHRFYRIPDLVLFGASALVIGLILRFRYYIAYRNRQLTRDAAFAKGGGYALIILSGVVIIAHMIVI